MDSRLFNALFKEVNNNWAANVLGMQVSNFGPDLADDRKFVEAKFGLKRSNWTLVGKQKDYHLENPNKEGFILLSIYELTKPISKIKKDELNESLVIGRFAYLLPWHLTIPLVIGSGRVDSYKYPDKIAFPRVTKSYEVEKGVLHLTEGVNPLLFEISGLEIKVENS